MTAVDPATEFSEIYEILRSGSPIDFELIRRRKKSFPDGVDDWIGRRWIINAIDSGSLAAVKWMIAQRVNLQFRDEEGFSVLHAAMERGHAAHIDMMRALISAGADVNIHGVNDWTPLHMAAFKDNAAAVQLLLESGADRSIRTRIDDYATAEEEASSDYVAQLIRSYGR